jgi:hypothetical protein
MVLVLVTFFGPYPGEKNPLRAIFFATQEFFMALPLVSEGVPRDLSSTRS